MTQDEALEILKTGRSAFITGAAGSGKTFLLNRYIDWLRKEGISVAITASTGIAATHLGGMTIHSWSGIGIRDSLSYEEAEALAERAYLRNQVRKASVLIIDEVSMLHDFRFDMVDRAVRALRGIPSIFGGMQVVLSGDFFQLPPVTKQKRVEQGVIQLDEEFEEKESEFIYHSRAWKELDPIICYLDEQFRQDDTEYVEILNAIRNDSLTKTHKETLRTRLDIALTSDSIPTKLYAYNVDVDDENDGELETITEPLHEYPMRSRGPEALIMALKKGVLAPEILRLKVGAKVMFVKNNFDAGYANGTTGTVIACTPESISVELSTGQTIIVEPANFSIEEDGKVKAEIIQYPLRLAWAITVHKSQGLTLESAEIDLSSPFERGMGYVALSRVKSLDGLSLKGLHDNAFLVHEEAQKMDEKFRALSEKQSKEFNKLPKSEITKMQHVFITNNGIRKKEKKNTVTETYELFIEGNSPYQIAQSRGLALGTILEHLETIKEREPSVSFFSLRNEFSTSRLQKILAAFKKAGTTEGGKRPIGPVHELLDGKVSYEELRLARLLL
jgi:ATP-dependent exoDNAse (exonuclease V) alpha subunit